VPGWIALLASLVVLSFASVPGYEGFSMVADRLQVGVRLTLVLALSVLVMRERFGTAARA
jgi:hypothetical protein